MTSLEVCRPLQRFYRPPKGLHTTVEVCSVVDLKRLKTSEEVCIGADLQIACSSGDLPGGCIRLQRFAKVQTYRKVTTSRRFFCTIWISCRTDGFYQTS